VVITCPLGVGFLKPPTLQAETDLVPRISIPLRNVVRMVDQGDVRQLILRVVDKLRFFYILDLFNG
jgi:hypothetical protein